MTSRRPANQLRPLEAYAANFDHLLRRLPQRRGFRDDRIGPLTLGERTRAKTLTALAGDEPVDSNAVRP